MAFQAINQAFSNYYKELPIQILPTIGQSAMFSFTIGVWLVYDSNKALDITKPLFMAGVAALASTIHALATPFFKSVLGKNNDNPVCEISKSAVVALTTSLVVGLATESPLKLTALKLYWAISVNSAVAWFKSWFPDIHDHNMNSIYLTW